MIAWIRSLFQSRKPISSGLEATPIGLQIEAHVAEEARLQRAKAEAEEAKEKSRLETKPKIDLKPRKIHNNYYKLQLTNVGKGTARNVNILLDGVPAEGHHVFKGKIVREMMPGMCCTYDVNTDMHVGFPKEILISWTDLQGESGQWKVLFPTPP